MARRVPSVVGAALDRVDNSLLRGGYRVVSVPTERVRAWLRFRGLAFLEPGAADAPSLADLDRSAEVVMARARSNASALSGAAGLGGAASIAPEVVGTTVTVLRLAQRLCVIYGFDPQTDRGRMALWRALAAAYDVDVPSVAPAELRISDLPSVMGRSNPQDSPFSGGLAAAMMRRSARWAAGRMLRFVPVVSMGTSATLAHGHMDHTGRRIQQVLRRLTEVPPDTDGPPEDAFELATT